MVQSAPFETFSKFRYNDNALHLHSYLSMNKFNVSSAILKMTILINSKIWLLPMTSWFIGNENLFYPPNQGTMQHSIDISTYDAGEWYLSLFEAISSAQICWYLSRLRLNKPPRCNGALSLIDVDILKRFWASLCIYFKAGIAVPMCGN